jgi:cold shock CspA family protein
MRGSIRGFHGKTDPAAFLAEGGKEVHFEQSEASSNRVDDLRVGQWVEFELQYGFERPCAVNVNRWQRDAGQRSGAPFGS